MLTTDMIKPSQIENNLSPKQVKQVPLCVLKVYIHHKEIEVKQKKNFEKKVWIHKNKWRNLFFKVQNDSFWNFLKTIINFTPTE